MISNLLVVAPIFSLILVGWIARRKGALGPAATREVNRLVVYLALPALLFDIMAGASLDQIWRPDFIVAFAAGCGVVFALTIAMRMGEGRGLADAAIDGLNASYANTGFMGFPLILAVVGETGMGPTLVATILTVSGLFAVAIVLIECSLQARARPHEVAWRTLKSLVRNPLLIAPALGAAALATGFHPPAPVERFLDLLGGAASPCALIALGLFLAGDAAEKGGEARPGTAGRLALMKLVVHPAATWAIAGPLMGLPAPLVHVAVLLAALPTGTGPFMLAEFYGREARLTGSVVLSTTALSVVTLSAYLAFAGTP
ncbi:AEC family transporter [Albimonas pacifica]|uniref:Transporter n=1 Tax=Albimonas pacifica TaxID=1114924 RepID=A0A1I3BLR7_9RHOB|nr:AEC family transporter [Albimonas pacifica]SFH63274.1 hypothetical protein SAMN05216258_101187 [Albimonas pacifica]